MMVLSLVEGAINSSGMRQAFRESLSTFQSNSSLLESLAGFRYNDFVSNQLLGAASWEWSIDGWIVLAAILSSVSATLLGCFLILRRMSLIGDAISHAVLPGIVAGYWLSGSANSLPIFLGAIAVGLLTVWLTEAARSIGKVDEGAATGVVFTGLFAVGLVLVSQFADQVDLDAGCVLYGNIENLPTDVENYWGMEIPRAIPISIGVLLLNVIVIVVLRRPLQITTFDPGLADSLGFRPTLIHYMLASLVAITCVSSFESIGNILVVAMFIIPPAAGFLLCNRLPWMMVISVLIAIASSILGHWFACFVPEMIGLPSTGTAAMMSVVAGFFLLAAILLSPRDGVFVRLFRRYTLAMQILREDILALLYRDQESQRPQRSRDEIRTKLLASPFAFRFALGRLIRSGYLNLRDTLPSLTEAGAKEAQNIVRSHRLWEQFLLSETGAEDARLHAQAESLEHYTDRRLREQLESDTNSPATDPHGRTIPPEV